MSRYPGAEIGADELPNEVHALADRIESITGKDVYFIDARRHQFEPGLLPAGAPPPPVSGPPSGPDIVVFVNPDVLDPQRLANHIRRFLIQALLVWEGYPLGRVRPGAVDEATASVVGLLQNWLHLSLFETVTESRLAALAATTVERRQVSRLPPSRLPPGIRPKLVDLESALGLDDVTAADALTGARAIADILRQADVKSPVGFRIAFGRILDLWGVRDHVVIGVADPNSGVISEVAW